jgi:hypothetical protein
MDLGKKSMKYFKAQMHIETTTTQEDHTIQSTEAAQKELQNDKANIKHPPSYPT